MRRAVVAATIAVLLALAGAAYAAVVTCQGGDCQGTDEADQITGTLGPDSIFANDGDDDADARAGHDFARGAEGADDIAGGRGEDTLRGNRDSDVIDGGPGDDNVFGHANTDQPPLNGTALGLPPPPPPPEEQLTDTATGDQDAVYGGPGYEVIDVKDGDDDDYINCGPDGAEVHKDIGDFVEGCFIPE